jgi:hypothetical protein
VSDQTAEDYRKRAADCSAIAARTGDPDARTQFEILAQQWMKLAEQREHFERLQGREGTGPPQT